MSGYSDEVNETDRLVEQKENRPPEANTYVALCIQVTELCERLTFHSIASNLVMFCTNLLKFNSVDAVTVSLVFTGTCYFFPLFGGWIADSFSGQYNAVLGSTLLHMLGTFFLPAAAYQYSQIGPYEMPLISRQVLFLIGLFIVAIGTGGIKANVSPFGAQQVVHAGPKALQTFFYWYYWFISVGAIIAYTGVVYVQQEIGFGIGYLIPALTMLTAVIIFTSARNKYIVNPPKGSQIETTIKILYEGLRNKHKQVPLDLPSFLDYAKIQYGGSRTDQEIEDVKRLGSVLLIFTTTVMYWTIFAQLNSSYLLQAERMDLDIAGFVLPAASLHIFMYIVIFFLVPFLDRIVYPLLDKCWRRPTPLVRMGLGFFLSAMSVAVAGVIEHFRKIDIEEHGAIDQIVGGEVFSASHMSVLYQIPQFLLFGAGSVLMEITALEFAFTEAPASLKGVVTGAFFVCTGLGQYVGTALVSIVNAATAGDEWFPNEINQGHMDYFLYLLAALEILALIVFSVLAKFYKYSCDRYVHLVESNTNDSTPQAADIGLHTGRQQGPIGSSAFVSQRSTDFTRSSSL